jgi:hypothetical protein
MASLRSKIETALVSALSGLGADVYAGIAIDDKVLPRIVISARSAEEDMPNSGNYRVTFEIEVRDNAGPDSTFDAICEAVRAVVKTDEFASGLTSTAAGLHVWGISAPERVEWGTSGDAWTETRTIEIICCPSSFP